jgi:Phospholipase_D-nuclease N-terminal
MPAALLAYTFGTGLAFAALAVWVFVWILVAVRVVKRRDLGILGKVVWLAVILLIPLLGLLAYFLWDAARPRPT